MTHRILALVICALALVSELPAAELCVGAAAVRITPDKPMPLAGYYNTRLATNRHDELHAKAIVLEQAGVKAALVVCDLLSLPRSVIEQTREIISRTTGVPGANVMISATHTHTGPLLDNKSSRNITDSSSSAVVSEYTAQLPAKIAESVRQAEAALTPTRVAIGHEHEEHLAFNRRFHMRDGTVGWNPGKLNTNIVVAAGPIDPDVAVVLFESPRRAPIASYVNFAMHPDTVGGLEYSADYAFTLARLLDDYHGSNMVTVFANGACGDINHIDVKWAGAQKGHTEAARLGTILAGNVLKAYTRLDALKPGALRVRSEMVKLALPELKPGEVEAARAVVAQIGSTNTPKFFEQVQAFKTLDVLDRAGRPHEVEVQVIALGDNVAWVSLPGEIFVELGMAIKNRSPFEHTMIAELANGSIGYIPTRRAFDEGNYEPISARCAAGSGEKLVEVALKLLQAAKNSD